MAKPSHWVVCKLCGRQFDVEKKGGVFDGNRYICKSCSKKKVIQRNNNGEATYTPSENKSWFKATWKILFGIFFLIGGFGNIGQDGQSALFGIIIGVLLTFAHFYPRMKARRLEKAEKAAEINAKNAELEAKRAEVKEIAEAPKRCKTCGATTKGKICEYCGSLLE
jgi:membrane protein insertase Oxa1/YidC/SpoIIIJ